ncbi:small CPxCG-related zinc finger protein [Natronomonas moolapensis 8.8.11]|uniref:Small CPxCG-related zinc finger protein n=1 Tax=Natronomonas moolapensis (strain DSM 18674 / CECT 7526 / JCM 14361 / 8.8.11) TaxID=268739 RepID=M1XTQ4_NATM8|nr:small CPxCG-related zinc finger protein [Natronomonas moolapensis 8.8.11]
MGSYVFGCSECGQEIEVDASMRTAILSNGCPVCTEPARTECFEPTGT